MDDLIEEILAELRDPVPESQQFTDLEDQVPPSVRLPADQWVEILSDAKDEFDWLVGCFGFNGPLRQYFSLYRAVSQREGERKER